MLALFWWRLSAAPRCLAAPNLYSGTSWEHSGPACGVFFTSPDFQPCTCAVVTGEHLARNNKFKGGRAYA